MATLPGELQGECSPRFRGVAELLAHQLGAGHHHGVSVAVRHRGQPVVDVWGGRRRRGDQEEAWGPDTMAVSFSTTKGVSATGLHMAMERNRVDYDTPVAQLWPGFAAGGKGGVTIRQFLCHEAGVPHIRDQVPGIEAMADWDAMVAMMESLVPLWEPGTANGYHTINFGWVVGELVRRIDGRDLHRFLAEEIAGPLQLDGLFVGTPPEEHDRVAPVHGAETVPENLRALLPPGHLVWRTLFEPADMQDFVNSKQGLESVAPAFSGCFTARSLATLYAALERGGSLGPVRLLEPDTLATATAVQNTRQDLVLFVPMNWRLGYMGGASFLSPVGPHPEAFGHSGFGGSVALADPRAEIAMAVILDRLEIDFLAGERVRSLVMRAVEAAVAG